MSRYWVQEKQEGRTQVSNLNALFSTLPMEMASDDMLATMASNRLTPRVKYEICRTIGGRAALVYLGTEADHFDCWMMGKEGAAVA